MKNFTFLLALLVLTFSLKAQYTPPTIQWQKCLGGSLGDFAESIQQTKDGGYIVAGVTFSNDGDVFGNHSYDTADFWVVKLDTSGNIQWKKCLGGSDYEYAESIRQTNDGGYIVAGYAKSNDGDVSGIHSSDTADFWVVKLDTSGNIQWQKCLGGSAFDYAYSIQQTNDGRYIVAGYTASDNGNVSVNHGCADYWVVKLDTSGNIQWQKCLGGSLSDQAYSIKQTKDDGYIVAGFTASNDGDVSGNHDTTGYFPDYWVVKLDTSGNVQWQKCLGGSDDDEAESVEQPNDGGFIVAGNTISNDGDVSGNHGGLDFWIVKLDSSRNIQWQKCLGGSLNDFACQIHQTNDGGYIVAGSTFSNDGDVSGNHNTNGNSPDCWIVKLDSLGNIQWQKCLGGSDYDWANPIQQTNDGGYIVAGEASLNNGDVSGNHGDSDFWVVKLSATSGIQKNENISNIAIYPNPSENFFNVSLTCNTKYIEIINYLGQVIEKRYVINQTTSTFEVSESGIYLIRIITDKEIITKIIIKVK